MTTEAAEILHELKLELHKANSPWLGRQAAAAYCAGCHPTTVDRAADEGRIRRYYRGGDGLPAYKRVELDAWMEGKAKRKAK